MLKRIVYPIILGFCVWAEPLSGQYTAGDSIIPVELRDMVEGESRDVPCPSRLNNAFGYQAVAHQGHFFWSQWHSDLTNYPLPSYNWYHAYPNRDPVSDDERAIWKNARIQVHCWVYKAYWLMQWHYDIVARSGSVEANCDRSGGGEALWAEAYDPYAADAPRSLATEDCDGDDSSGGGGGKDCTWVYADIQISYNGGRTWDTLWSGYACQTQ